MAPQERQPDTTLTDRLLEEFYRFSFYKAVGLIESLFPDKKPLGQTLLPGEEAVRFSSKPGFVFPPSDISKIELGKKGENPVNMEVPFMGLVGPSGVLPNWQNELVIARSRKKDFGLKAFYDIFNHRLISIFYLAWKKHRLTENYLPGAKDRVSSYFINLVGLGTPDLLEKFSFPEKSLMYYYSGLLSRQTPSAVAIEATVGYFSDTSVNVVQFIDRIIPISPEDQTQIGMANGQLGVDTVCGSYAWESQTKFRVSIGPMGYKEFLHFLPDGKMLGANFSLVRYMVGIEFEFEISLILKREEVPLCRIGEETPTSPRLGWTSWIKTPGEVHSADPEVVFQEISG